MNTRRSEESEVGALIWPLFNFDSVLHLKLVCVLITFHITPRTSHLLRLIRRIQILATENYLFSSGCKSFSFARSLSILF